MVNKMIYIDDNDPEGVLEASFPYRDVTIKWGVDANGIFEIIDEIGRGKFGTVFKCKEKSTGLRFAAKFVPIPKREDRRNVEREVEIMNSLQHHLIIQLYAAYEYQKMMCVVQELVEGGELFDRVIDDEFVLTERVCTVFVRQVCEAMQFIHRNNILHLDLKPENILCLTKEGNRIKIIDFGLARKYDPNKKLQILFGTPEFVAPEVVNFDCISYGTDMWSVGVICYVLLSGLSPFMGETDITTMANVTIAKYDFDDEAFNNVSAYAMDFITKLLLKDCSSRMTATECLDHKWLKRKPKLKKTPPSPVTISNNVPVTDEAKELEQTKNNLKVFIERWEEHPNSPYAFDIENNTIDSCKVINPDSMSSSRVYSPSPCESIGSVIETAESNKDNSHLPIISDNKQPIYNKNFNESGNQNWTYKQENSTEFNNINKQQPDEQYNRNFKDYLQSFDRRKSDTNSLFGKPSAGERLNLAEEIRKLSDHLLMLAQINTKLVKANSTDEIDIKKAPNEEFLTPNINNYSEINDTIKNINNENHILKNGESEINVQLNDKQDVKIRNLSSDNFDKDIKNVTIDSKNEENQNNPITSPNSVGNNISVIDDSEPVEVIFSLPSSADRISKSKTSKKDNSFTKNKLLKQSKFMKASSVDSYVPFSTITSSPTTRSGMNESRVSKLTLRLQKSLENESFLANGKCDDSDENVELTVKIKTKASSGKTTRTKKSSLSKATAVFNDLNNSKLNEFSCTNEYFDTTKSIPKILSPPRRKFSVTSFTSISPSPLLTQQINSDHKSSFDMIDNSTMSTDILTVGVPWTITKNKRTKFRINQTSRDVPLGSPNTHQSYNLEEAATNTKDCLLHLLEKYDNKLRTSNCNTSGRHRSISVDWNVADNLEYRSMNSINTFFQRNALTGDKVKKLQAQLESNKKK